VGGAHARRLRDRREGLCRPHAASGRAAALSADLQARAAGRDAPQPAGLPARLSRRGPRRDVDAFPRGAGAAARRRQARLRALQMPRWFTPTRRATPISTASRPGCPTRASRSSSGRPAG
jgi:hypothetical protein